MAKIYYRKIIAGEMMITDVPARWQAEVQALLDGNQGGTNES